MNGNEMKVTPGFIVSMAGLSEIPFGLAMMFLIDHYVPMEPIIAGISLGQFVAGVMIVLGIGVFFYGRHLGWKPRDPAGAPGLNPVKRR